MRAPIARLLGWPLLALMAGLLATPSRADLAVPPLAMPTPVVRMLPNGLTVAVFPSRRLPIVQVQLSVPFGSAADPAGREGAAALTASMLRRGSSSRSSSVFDAEFTRLGATFATGVTPDASTVAVALLAPQFEAGLELLSDAVIQALFPEEELALARREAAQRLGERRRSPAGLADDQVLAALFPAHPYGHATDGTVESLLRLGREPVREFHRDFWRPDRAVLTISGDIEPARAFAAAEDWLGRWSGRAVTTSMAARSAPSPRTQLLDLGDWDGAEVRLAWTAAARAEADVPAWNMAVAALNEPGRLPPGARAAFTPLQSAGLFVVSASTRADSAVAKVRALQQAVREWAIGGSGTGDANAARLVRETWAMPLETIGAPAAQWVTLRFAGAGDDALTRMASLYSKAQGAAAARSVLAAPGAVVVAGSATRLRQPLERLGRVEVIAPDSGLAQMDAPGVLAPATPEQLRRGRELAAAAAVAHGGAARLRALRDATSEGTLRIHTPTSPMDGIFSLTRKVPYRMLYSTKVFEFESSQVLDGDQSWSRAQTNDSSFVIDADARGVQSMKVAYESDFLNLILAALDPASGAAYRGREAIGTRAIDWVDLRTRSGGLARLGLDSRTRRVATIDLALRSDGIWHERRVLSDYRLVSGIWWPHVEERRIEGEKASTQIIRRLGLDLGIRESAFARPLR